MTTGTTIGRLRTLKTSALAGGKTRRSLFAMLVLLLGTLLPAAAASLPAREWAMLRDVAKDYGLSEEGTWLLAAIRLHENGRPGLEFGVGGPMNSGHRAHRYRDGVKSFRVQCAWAAGTIKRRYTGDLVAFGKRYNPLNAAQWSRNIARIIARLKRHHRGILPACNRSPTCNAQASRSSAQCQLPTPQDPQAEIAAPPPAPT